MQMREQFETEFLNTGAMQKVRFPILFPLKGSCIELASMGSVHIYIHHQTAVIVTTSG
jgi:hypothetical protein